MKKILVVIAAALIAVSANAQWYAGGSLGLNVSKDQSNLSFTPEAGYVFNENWSAGLALSIYPSWFGNDSQCSFNINPYARYTFLRKGNFSLFADAIFNFNINSYRHEVSNPISGEKETFKSSSNMVGVVLAGGAAYQVTNHFSIVAHVVSLGWHQNQGITFGVTTPSSIGVYYSF